MSPELRGALIHSYLRAGFKMLKLKCEFHVERPDHEDSCARADACAMGSLPALRAPGMTRDSFWWPTAIVLVKNDCWFADSNRIGSC